MRFRRSHSCWSLTPSRHRRRCSSSGRRRNRNYRQRRSLRRRKRVRTRRSCSGPSGHPRNCPGSTDRRLGRRSHLPRRCAHRCTRCCTNRNAEGSSAGSRSSGCNQSNRWRMKPSSFPRSTPGSAGKHSCRLRSWRSLSEGLRRSPSSWSCRAGRCSFRSRNWCQRGRRGRRCRNAGCSLGGRRTGCHRAAACLGSSRHFRPSQMSRYRQCHRCWFRPTHLGFVASKATCRTHRPRSSQSRPLPERTAPIGWAQSLDGGSLPASVAF